MEDSNVVPLRPNNLTCPNCESQDVTTKLQKDTFVYGEGDNQVELSAQVPVRSCRNCGFNFTDRDADTARHREICKHLDILTPDEITKVRERYGISRAQFSRITKIGEASINRWENGVVIQNQAMDNYLRLLSLPENFEQICTRRQQPSTTDVVVYGQFRTPIDTQENQDRASNFRLWN